MDQQSGQCVLFNDRYGAERLFIHSDQSRVYFASEAKAILAVVASTSAPDFAGVAEWLSCGSTIGGRSLFRGVEILPGGSVITFT